MTSIIQQTKNPEYVIVILYEASHCGYFYTVIDDAKFEYIRPVKHTCILYEFAASMGQHPVLALDMFMDCLMAGGSIGRTGTIYMLYYYLTYNQMPHETLCEDKLT